MKNKQHVEDLQTIRSIMEKSSRFISLSGLSGVFAGIFALLGAGIMYAYYDFKLYPYYEQVYQSNGEINTSHIITVVAVALSVLVLAISFGIYFTVRKAKRNNEVTWGPVSKRLLFNMAVPLASGGAFSIVLAYYGAGFLIAPATLIFYGISLHSASKYTFDEIRYLGLTEIALGFVGCFLPMYSLLIWAIGFGLCHIIYGIAMYRKYD